MVERAPTQRAAGGELESRPSNFEILTPHKFLNDLRAHAERAVERIWVQTMHVVGGQTLDTVADILQTGRVNNVMDVRFHYDGYSLMFGDQRPNWAYIPGTSAHREHRRSVQRRDAALARMHESGVAITVTNMPSGIGKLAYFANRNHCKLAIVDNVAWLGGLGFRDNAMHQHDFMMRITDPDIVDALAGVFTLFEGDATLNEDLVIQCNDETTIIVDAGIPGKSTILDTAIELINRAQKSASFTTQYNLGGTILRAFRDLEQRGGTSQTIASNSGALGKMTKLLGGVGDKRPPVLIMDGVHAKLLILDAGQPTVIAGTGSHNLADAGVWLGTEEIFMFSTNPTFIANLSRFFTELVEKHKQSQAS